MRNLLRLIGIAGAAGFLTVSVMSFGGSVQAPAAGHVTSRAPAGFSPLPSRNAEAAQHLLERSPFVSDRSAFDRAAALVPPTAPMTVRLTGISKVGKELRASLVIDGQAISVKKGDQTPVGIVLDIEPIAVVIGGASPQRIEMFKQ